MVLLVASRIPASGALLLNLAGEVSTEASPLRVPEVMGTVVEFSTVVCVIRTICAAFFFSLDRQRWFVPRHLIATVV